MMAKMILQMSLSTTVSGLVDFSLASDTATGQSDMTTWRKSNPRQGDVGVD
jgi:hypothetical protein